MKRYLSILMILIMVIAMTGCTKKESESASRGINMRFAWWGPNARNEKMNAVLDMYEAQHPGVTISREYTAFADHWIKYNTQAAAGTDPDVSLHVMQSVQEYVNKGVIIPLDEFRNSGKINISDWSQNAIAPGIVNGKLYGITYALTAQGVLYNSQIISNAGLPPPSDNWTYDEFVQYCNTLQAKLPTGIYAVHDTAYSDHAVESFMRSRGKTFYNAAGTGLGFAKEDLAAWFKIWDDLRRTGAAPSAALTAEIYRAPYEQELFGSNRAAMIIQNGNNVTTYQRLLEGEVKIVRLPKSNRDIPGDFFQPTLFGISSKSKLADEAAVFIDWMVNDVESNLLFKAEYGIPADPDVSKALQAIATSAEIKNYQFSALVLADTKVPPSSARAEGSAAIMDTLLKLVYEDISAEISSIDASVNRFFTEAEAILSKNKPNG